MESYERGKTMEYARPDEVSGNCSDAEKAIAQKVANDYRDRTVAGENPNLEDFLNQCPTPASRKLALALCAFDVLMAAALE